MVDPFDFITKRDDVKLVADVVAGLEVHEFADDVDAGKINVIEPFACRQRVVEFAGFCVNEVGGEFVCVTTKQRVGK
ncbi:Uncharacterised protein [Chlamydia trachomatis]|nr:Uncharacterised protein [Chlamydia trachomatis]